jgi:hypothetical protein
MLETFIAVASLNLVVWHIGTQRVNSTLKNFVIHFKILLSAY